MTVEEIKQAAIEASASLKKELEATKSEFQAQVKDRATTLELKATEDKLVEVASKMEEIQNQLDAVEKKGAKITSSEKGLSTELREKLFTPENIKGMKSGQRINIDNIAFKAVSDMTRTYSATTGLRDIFADVEAGVAKAPKIAPTVLDYIRIGTTNSEILKWVVKVLAEGGIGQTAEGVKFSQVSYKWDKEQSSAKKTTGYAKLSKENIEDVDFALSETLAEMGEDFLLQVASQVLSGDGIGENHSGILTNATAFARQTGVGQLAGVTNRDVLEHAYLQVRVGGKGRFAPNAVMMNPVDVTKLKTLKDTTGQYIMPLYLSNTGYDVNGIPIVENDSITAGDFLIGDFTKFGWFNYRALNISTYDQNEDDVLKDFITVAGSLRAISRIKSVDTKAFVKGTFSTAITALQAI